MFTHCSFKYFGVGRSVEGMWMFMEVFICDRERGGKGMDEWDVLEGCVGEGCRWGLWISM